MDLTTERKLQIEAEERQRWAEAQYHSELHARLAGSDTRTPTTQPHGKKSHFGLMLVIAIVISRAVVAVRRIDAPTHVALAPSIRYVPLSQKIATGQLALTPGGYIQYPIEIKPAMRDARVVGTFGAAGGAGKRCSSCNRPRKRVG